ncbi:MAG: c-type cytochrome biogenesis protein CcmI [Candidatus Binatus sp.]|uniref:c-type cytochrome biogenesis protein CcmI n=1 Tax=Candidatus Binatus sp. TaxID=2811406 RepID=UPI00271E3AE8|nr:c-type cytochrome biogenesis protein CcmI [Candidatus Binatus sp.]MDO8432061.1 c-type cytochrome biogenesis protein CcmI [Candidatus Binatus sp.]
MFIAAAILIIAGVALFVAAPLGIGLIAPRDKSAAEVELNRHEHQRALAVQGLRELEFDREMGKLSDADYRSMHQELENRALTAMTAIEKIRHKSRDDAQKKQAVSRPTSTPVRVVMASTRRDAPTIFTPRAEPSLTTSARRIRFCPQCGTRAATDANFCAECGVALKSSARATNWNE